MRKLTVLILALVLIAACACAEEIMESTQTIVDLDGNGEKETLFWAELPIDEYVTESVMTITAEDGSVTDFTFGDLFNTMVYIDDCDGDGIMEIFASGDIMSDDYYTCALQYRAGELTQLKFADSERSGENSGYIDCGYGYVSDLGGGTVQLTGSQDFFGTYFASREFRLENGVFEFADDGFFTVNWDVNNPDVWEYYAMTPLAEIPCTLIDGDSVQNASLQPGTRLIMVACDKESEARFLTEDGKQAVLPITFNEQDGYGYCVYGTPEEEIFDGMHYAD